MLDIQSVNERCHPTENNWSGTHSKQWHHLHNFEKIKLFLLNKYDPSCRLAMSQSLMLTSCRYFSSISWKNSIIYLTFCSHRLQVILICSPSGLSRMWRGVASGVNPTGRGATLPSNSPQVWVKNHLVFSSIFFFDIWLFFLIYGKKFPALSHSACNCIT